MNKKFLVTVSDDYANLTSLEFICSFFKQLSEHQITLLHISRLDAADMNKALMKMWEGPDGGGTGKLTIGARKALDKAVAMLKSSEMAVEQMITKTFAERYGKVKDILNEGSEGLYDAIILGKRASYTLQWFFERSADETAQSIIQDSSLKTPIWICPEPEAGRKNVLVCVDGSRGALRAVDHVGYILSRQDQHTITLFHVENGAGLNTEEMFREAKQILQTHEISEDRIKTETDWGISVAATIAAYAQKYRFAAVAVGLEGSDQSLLKRINLGGITTSLITRTEKFSLWCCP